jgi:hypothetical protein
MKESRYWLQLFEIKGQGIEEKRRLLIDEPSELLKIFGAIIEKIK